MRWLVALLACGCTVSVELEGKECAGSEPLCLPGYACVGGRCVKRGGSLDAGPGCAQQLEDPAASTCAGNTYYLSPTGDDAQDGGTPSTARRTLSGITLRRGDIVSLLGGTWAQAPSLGPASGNASCPLLLRGEPDGGTVLRGPLSLENDYLVVRWLTFAAQNQDGLVLTQSAHVTLQAVTFALPEPTSGFPVALKLNGPCTDCTVRESTFASGPGVALMNGAAVPGFRFFGNRIVLAQLGEGLSLEGPGAVVEGNDFTGRHATNDGVIDARNAAGALITRNVFHDIEAWFADKPFIVGGRISHNTFAGLRSNTSPLVRNVERFDSNLVVDTDHVLSSAAPDGGDYNVFDPSVNAAYAGGGMPNGTDRVAAVRFDGLTWVPTAGSAAIDSANPADAVPSGGGLVADVGALERGATLLPDGRYCLGDGGASR